MVYYVGGTFFCVMGEEVDLDDLFPAEILYFLESWQGR
jgi:hypothetical protein